MADFTEAQITEFKEAFSLFDDDSDGLIDASTCLKVLRSCGQCPSQALLKTLKPQSDFSDFLSLISRTDGSTTASEEAEIREAFYVFDQERTGFVNVEQLKRVLKTVGEPLSHEELMDVIKDFDVKDGRVAIDDFVRVMMTKG
ncbi:calmodulin [Powellomyces hirtus]|nr:calmodulin [Powellomyces hirtus]